MENGQGRYFGYYYEVIKKEKVIIRFHRRTPSLLRPVMANKLAIGALAAAAVAAAPALAQEAPSPSPGSHQALRVCADAARENALEGCEALKGLLEAQDVAIECVVLDGCLEAEGPLTKVRLGSAGPQATQMIYCILRIENRSLLSAILRSARARENSHADRPPQLSWGRTGLPMGRLRPRRSYNSHSTVPHHSCTYSQTCISLS